MLKGKSSLRVGLISLVTVILLSTGAYAANKVYRKKVMVTFGTVNFESEGRDITKEIENKYDTPGFIMESRSYVPVKAIGDVLGVNVDYDESSKTVKITDPKKAELEEKDGKIKNLEIENANLKKELESLKKPEKEDLKLKDVEKKLNKDMGQYMGVYFDISLKERNNNLDLELRMNLKDRDQYRAWTSLNTLTKKYLVEDVVQIIDDNLSYNKLEGKLYDENSRVDLITFDKREGKKLYIDYAPSIGSNPSMEKVNLTT